MVAMGGWSLPFDRPPDGGGQTQASSTDANRGYVSISKIAYGSQTLGTCNWLTLCRKSANRSRTRCCTGQATIRSDLTASTSHLKSIVATCTVPMDVRCDPHRNSAEDEQILVWSMTTDLVDVAVETKAGCFGPTGAFNPCSTLDARLGRGSTEAGKTGIPMPIDPERRASSCQTNA
jgi:hypothetical protein